MTTKTDGLDFWRGIVTCVVIYLALVVLILACALAGCGCRTRPGATSLRPWQGAITNDAGEVRPTW